jgi:transposase
MAALEAVSAEDIRQILTEVDDADAVQRLMPAITYKEIVHLTQAEAAELYGFSSTWASKWFNRLERLNDEPFEDIVYDEPRSGRASKLSESQHQRFVEDIHEPPEEAGLDARAWTVPLTQHYRDQEFDVKYCVRHVRRLMTEAGLSRQTARSQYVNADERTQEAFRDGLKKLADLDDEYTVIVIDQTRQELANLVYTWLPEGKRLTLPVSGAWESVKLLGGITDDGETFYPPCGDNFTSDLTVRSLDALQTGFGEKLCIALLKHIVGGN